MASTIHWLFSSVVGISSFSSPEAEGIIDRADRYSEGYWSAIPISIVLNTFYAPTVSWLCKKERPRLYSNLFCAAVNIGGYFYYDSVGVQDPLSTIALPAGLGFLMTNAHVNEELKKD